jgi:DNA/RNA endonuclease YhcR with UshA esterase domain
VRAAGTITEGPIDDSPFGDKFFIDDGSGPINVYVNVGTKVDVSRLTVGQRVVVTGFSSEFDGVPEIDIRGPQDLRLAR